MLVFLTNFILTDWHNKTATVHSMHVTRDIKPSSVTERNISDAKILANVKNKQVSWPWKPEQFVTQVYRSKYSCEVLVQIHSAVKNLSSSQDFWGHCCLTLTSDPHDLENIFSNLHSHDEYLWQVSLHTWQHIAYATDSSVVQSK